MLNVSVNNAWLLYRRDLSLNEPDKKFMTLKVFRASIAKSIIAKNWMPRTAGTPNTGSLIIKRKVTSTIPLPDNNIRFDQVRHFANLSTRRGRCRLCLGELTDVECVKCKKIKLCLVRSRNCFYKFHHK